MELKIIFALVACLLSVLFIRWAKRYVSYGGIISLPEFERFLILLAGGFPLTLLVVGVFLMLGKLFGVEVKLYGKIEVWTMRTAVVIQWLVWLQLLALLILNL